ncbi:hypothetical protein [Streptomyces sp. NPDC021020]
MPEEVNPESAETEATETEEVEVVAHEMGEDGLVEPDWCVTNNSSEL